MSILQDYALSLSLSLSLSLYIYIYIYIYTHTHISIYMYICVCVRVCIIRQEFIRQHREGVCSLSLKPTWYVDCMGFSKAVLGALFLFLQIRKCNACVGRKILF